VTWNGSEVSGGQLTANQKGERASGCLPWCFVGCCLGFFIVFFVGVGWGVVVVVVRVVFFLRGVFEVGG